MPQPDPVVFLLDVDNTLLDNDQVYDDLRRPKMQAFGVERQQRYAHDPKTLATYPLADVTIDHIGDLLRYDLPALPSATRPAASGRN